MEYTGKQYVAIDNSYESNLSNSKADIALLAGSKWRAPVLTTIKTEPFVMSVYSPITKGYKLFDFVIVEDIKGTTYSTLFYEHGVIKDTNTFEYMVERNKINHSEDMF